jgi:hypothetical protein
MMTYHELTRLIFNTFRFLKLLKELEIIFDLDFDIKGVHFIVLEESDEYKLLQVGLRDHSVF